MSESNVRWGLEISAQAAPAAGPVGSFVGLLFWWLEIDVFAIDNPTQSAWSLLIAPIHISVANHVVRRRRSPFRHVFRCMGIADKRCIVAARKCAMKR